MFPVCPFFAAKMHNMETGKVILPGARIVIFLTLEGQKKYGEK